MSKYDKEYFFVRKSKATGLPFLVPDANTEDRRFRYEAQAVGSPPLVFTNGWKDKFKAEKIKSSTPDILFAGADLVVRQPIREKLLTLSVPGMSLHPAVYIDDDGAWHEDYWYVTFTGRLDCWDRENSEYDEDEPPVELGGFQLHQVYTYSLNEQLLDEIPQDQRLLFKMGGDLNAFVVCHQSLAAILRGNGGSGAELQCVADY